MGLPLYGRTWKLKDPNVHGIGAPAVGVGPGDNGVLLYFQIVEFNAANNATDVFDKKTVSTYPYAGTNWLGYDNATSIRYKVEFARARRLGGYFFWAHGYDKDWTLTKEAFRTLYNRYNLPKISDVVHEDHIKQWGNKHILALILYDFLTCDLLESTNLIIEVTSPG
ncbi:PREDICTED: chitinase-like protein 4 [Nelumbo nucifera]|nr:PREDICTED: chitinase-like protein 4 [Nelumbo nucifera]